MASLSPPEDLARRVELGSQIFIFFEAATAPLLQLHQFPAIFVCFCIPQLRAFPPFWLQPRSLKAHPTAVPGPRPVVSFSVPTMALDPPVAPPPGMEDMHYDMARDIGQRVEALILDVTGTIWDGTAEWAGCGFYESYGARCYFCHVPSYLKSQHPN